MAAQFALLMADTNRERKLARISPTSFIEPIFMVVIGSTPFDGRDEAEGFLVVTATADKGMVYVRARQLPILSP